MSKFWFSPSVNSRMAWILFVFVVVSIRKVKKSLSGASDADSWKFLEKVTERDSVK